MKRKIFSKLLMGALLVASVSSFVSCKDYDDDINNLQDQINAKAAISELTALQNTLDGKISAAQSAAQAAQNTANEAATKVALAETKAALEKAIEDAKKAGTDAGTQAATAIAAANKAQETADAAAKAAKDADAAAQEALKKALEEIKATYATKAEAEAASKAAADAKTAADAAAAAAKAAQETANAAYTKAEAEALKAEVDALKEKIESGAADEALEKAIQEAKNAAASVEAIWSAITGISFYVDDNPALVGNVIVNSTDLNFQFGKQKDNVFGNGKELHSYEATDKPETYKAGNDIKAENIYFVRVSPVNADLAAADLKVINSLGEDLDEYVDIKAEAYKELLTRAGETGLWKVTVTLKDGVDREKLQKATNAKLSRDKKRTISSAIYAIAAGNSEEADASRFAVTSYNLKALTNDYTPTRNLNFTVNGVAIANIYNRWNAAGPWVVAEDGSMEKDSLYWELTWNTAAQAEKYNFEVPAVKAITNIAHDSQTHLGVNNYVRDNVDDRRAQAKLQVQPEEQIIIQFPVAEYPFVDRYYVQFEKDNAVESAPSEFESWKSYNATGLSEMKKASERLILTVPSDAAEGDIIGFRLYAVNYDGTLVDPDGKAFYVQVGFVPNAEESDILSGTFTARQAALAGVTSKTIIENKANGVIIPFDFSAKYPSIYKGTAVAAAAGLVGTVAIDPAKEQNMRWIIAAGTNVEIKYLKSDKLDAKGNAQEAATVGEIKYIALNVVNPENIIDEATVETDPLRIIDADKHNKVVGYLSFLIKKGDIIPNATTSTQDNKIAWKTGYNGTFYPWMELLGASGAWGTVFNTAANTKIFALGDYATGLDTYANLANYKWTIKKITKNATTEPLYDHPTLQMTAQNLTATAANDVSTVQATGGTATTFNLMVAPSQVTYDKQIQIVISDYAGSAGLSRTSLTTAPAAGAPHVYQTLTLNFKDIWSYQTYKNGPKYNDGALGATSTAPKDQTYYVRNSALAGGLQPAWINATMAIVAPATYPTVTAIARKTYPAGAALALGTILTTSENSVYTPFWGGPWAATQYVSFAEYDFNGDKTIAANDYAYYVKSESGAVNEYITPATLPTATNMATILGAPFAFTATVGAPALMTTINQTLVIKVVDSYGIAHDFSIPFELVP